MLQSVPASCKTIPDQVQTWGLPWIESHVLIEHEYFKFPYKNFTSDAEFELRKLKVPSDNTAHFIRSVINSLLE